ncbi:hypothetical protein SAMN05421827_11322 [Pedobacter terrae]|uniref:Uncharacterized protein n=1 Tax=Pedobacter terrae TaxID=405671 RepID=A0A1G7Y7V0_9SPHI|nr:hypothetical protein [Pedobacter terrae]SDG92545.1 hypothetical protein SAMN05421827_11322 [Pedobacter terrae]
MKSPQSRFFIGRGLVMESGANPSPSNTAIAFQKSMMVHPDQIMSLAIDINLKLTIY